MLTFGTIFAAFIATYWPLILLIAVVLVLIARLSRWRF